MVGMIILLVSGLFIAIIWCSLKASAESDERMHRALLVEEAKRKYPNMMLSSALDRLYCETLREIKRNHKKGNYDTQDLEDRLILLFNERNYWLQQEIESESTYMVH